MRTLEVVILQKWVTRLRDLMGEFFMKAEVIDIDGQKAKGIKFC